MRIALGSDHAGYELKQDLRVRLADQGVEVLDLGAADETPVDYPDIGAAVAERVSRGEADRGLLICGSGLGMSIVANRFPGVRAALCHDVYTSRMSREHNDANVLVLGGRLIGKGLAREILEVWLSTGFQGARHQKRLDKIAALEKKILAARRP